MNWPKQHTDLWNKHRVGTEASADSCIVAMATAWRRYAEIHKMRYESSIGEDGVCGEGWAKIGEGLRVLLVGEIGGLDAGTVDSYILDTARNEGVGEDDL